MSRRATGRRFPVLLTDAEADALRGALAVEIQSRLLRLADLRVAESAIRAIDAGREARDGRRIKVDKPSRTG